MECLNQGNFGKVQLQSLPKLKDPPTIGNVLPHFYRPSENERDQLILTEHEIQKFEQHGKGAKSHLIHMHSQLGTALHSWGNQVQECACKCRKAFSDDRLIKHGLHGAVVLMEEPTLHFRHIAPKEMAILCGFPKSEGMDDTQRLLMAGIGQLASPIQSSWIFSQIRNHFHDLRMCGLTLVKPRQILACVCADLFRLRDQWFPEEQPPASITMFQETIEELLDPNNREIDSRTIVNNGAKDPAVNTQSSEDTKEPNSTDKEVSEFQEQWGVDTMSQDDALLTAVKGAENEQGKKEETNKEDPKIVDEATGGLTPFSSRSEPVKRKIVAEPREIIPVSQDTEVQHRDQPVKNHLQTSQQDTTNITIWYHKENCYSQVQCSPTSTVGDLVQGEKTLQQTEFIEALSTIGKTLDHKELLVEQSLVIIMEGTPVVQKRPSEHAQEISHWPRPEAALLQQGAVAVDEMAFYLEVIKHNVNVPISEVAPLWISSFADMSVNASEWKTKMQQVPGISISAVLYQEHWIPIVAGTNAEGYMKAYTTPEGKQLWPLLFPQDCEEPDIGVALGYSFKWDCGFQALAWIAAGVQMLTYRPITAKAAHEWRKLFWQYSKSINFIPKELPFRLGGHQSELEVALSAILKEHGVFADRLQDRTKEMIDAIGTTSLINALRSNRPWVAIKQLANQSSPKLRLIREDEFQKVIQSRASQNRSIGTRKNKNEKPLSNRYLMPSDVTVPTGVFTQQDGQAVPHLDIRQVTPNAKGVVVATESEFQPYSGQKQLSQEGLAFLVLAPYSSEIAAAGQEIRFPAQSTSTSEPVLLSAVMIQKGNQSVQRCLPKNQMQIAQVPTQTVKFLVYKDQYPNAWQDIVDRPVKQILEMVPELRMCKTDNCRCNAWHPNDHHGEEPILDVWQRDFLNIHFKKSKPADAAIFTCMMRLNKECFDIVTNQSGTDGLYCEARSTDGYRQDEEFHTVWLSKHTIEEARVAKVTSAVPATLIRVSNRYGLRVGKEDAKATHDAFRPDTPF